jgi:predicted metal-dependent peptidase
MWNIAADHVVNLMLKASGFELPSGGMEDPQFVGMSAEQVYSKILQDQAKQQTPKNGQGKAVESGTGQPSGQGQQTAPGSSNGGSNPVLPGCKTGDFTDGPKQGEEQIGQLSETGWQIAVEQALRVASMAGTVPAGMQAIVEGTRAPRVDWISELRDFITHTVPNNYSWSTPARRFISQGLYLPGVQNENLGTIVVAVDSSGSTTPFLENFTSEFRGILREARPERVVLIYCDAAIQSATEMVADDFDAKLTIKGGGGTKFGPVFTHVEKEGIEPVALIYLTDLDNSDRVTEPGYPVLWCTPEYVSKQAPFGRTVRIQEVK